MLPSCLTWRGKHVLGPHSNGRTKRPWICKRAREGIWEGESEAGDDVVKLRSQRIKGKKDPPCGGWHWGKGITWRLCADGCELSKGSGSGDFPSLCSTKDCAKGQPCDRLVLSSVGLNLPCSFQTFPPEFIQCQSTGLDFQNKDGTENSLLIPQLNYSVC